VIRPEPLTSVTGVDRAPCGMRGSWCHNPVSRHGLPVSHHGHGDTSGVGRPVRHRPERSPAIRSRHRALSLLVLSALAVLLVVTPASAAVRKIALGVSMTEGHGSVAAIEDAMDGFAAATGRMPAIFTLWSQWGQPQTQAFPTEAAAAVRAKGAVPMIWWEPVIPPREKEIALGCPYSRHSRIAAGEHDAYIKSWARAAKRFKTTVLLRYSHEINGKYFPWTTAQCGNTVKAYKQGWKRVFNLFQQVGATNVKFVWTVAKQNCRTKGCNPYKPYYPGDKFVHYAGFSSFNWGAQKSWKTMVQGASVIMSFLKTFTSKPVIIAELATNRYGGPTGTDADKPAWIRDGYPAVYSKFPQIKAIVYLNEDLTGVGHPDWSLNTPSGAIGAYAELLTKARFRGTIR
jgi:hypothetical protein